MRTNILYYISALLCILAGVPSCTDENLDEADYTVAGVPVTVAVKVRVPEMQRRTRAAIDEYNLDYVQDLWVRTYSASTGKATGEALTLTPATHDTEGDGGIHDHDIMLKTQSGDNYIVAVANTAANRGFSSMDAGKTERPLAELLAEADTWEKFLSIVALAPSTEEQINHPATPVPMAGCYLDLEAPGHGDPYNISQWQTDDFRSYFIPASKSVHNMTGAIHLRRLVSNVKFCFMGGDGIDLKVNSYRVVNVPVYSWLYERGTIVQAGNDIMLANYGDLAESKEDASNYYTEESFKGNMVRDGKYYGFEDGSVGFDFWMAENKHQGNDNCTSYTQREKLVSSASTLFSSLADAVSTNAKWTPNQMATYVVVSCTVDYKEAINVDENGKIVGEGGASAHRTGVVQYLIHLGYIDGADEREKSKDFNTYRNADYTYNVTVNGIDDIRVEAFFTYDKFPGEGGTVTDLINKQIELDAHYNTFNVKITDEERDLQGFGFTIMTCRNGQEFTFNERNFEKDGTLNSGSYITEEDKELYKELYNWIEIRPTSSEYVLSEYRPRSGDYADGKTFLLSQIMNIPEDAISESGWYTVFVNEYTYEPMYDADNTDNNYGNETNSRWKEYVNQNPRRFFINTTRQVSNDWKSIYTRSKYGVVQYSMQTYYSGSGVGSGSATAIGVERINETEGLNMRRSYLKDISNKRNNGRLNVAYWLIGKIDDNNDLLWDKFVDRRAPQMIGAVTGVRAQNGPELPDRTRSGDVVKLPALAPYEGYALSTFSDPQNENTNGGNSQFVEGINACMNRNRDNNGDGLINPQELRWYVPAMGEYLRIIIGSESLDQPLLNFRSVSGIPRKMEGVDAWAQSEDSYEVKNDYASRYMFIASNEYEVLWAMEGTSTSSWIILQEWSEEFSYPWQVRCVRNLGTDLTTVKDEDNSGVSPAYEVEGNVVNMKYYDISSIRGNRYSGNGKGTGFMPVHLNTDIYNMVCRRFEFDTEDIVVPDTFKTADKMKDYIEGNPCRERNIATDKDNWRVPNQKELTIVQNSGALNGQNQNIIWTSCTASYFNMATGAGGRYIDQYNYLLGSTSTNGTLMTVDNIKRHQLRIRCVRDAF